MRIKVEGNATYLGYQSSIQHSGIKGMKWGVRRFQNLDGSLTPEGKIRYGGDTKVGDVKRQKTSTSKEEIWRSKDAETLSDDELNKRNRRLQQEQQYKNLTTTESERNKKEFNKDLIRKLLIIPVVGIAAVALKKHYKTASDWLGKKAAELGKKAVSNIKTKNWINQLAKKYSNPGVTLKTEPRSFNYRPRNLNNLDRKSYTYKSKDLPNINKYTQSLDWLKKLRNGSNGGGRFGVSTMNQR